MDYVQIVNAANAQEMYPRIIDQVKDKGELFKLLERLLMMNPSLWYTPYGNTFGRLGGGSKPPFSIPKSTNYTIVIYNRYER